jgi:NTP pyrophosphatase (non-canonical NTP hydrolase)
MSTSIERIIGTLRKFRDERDWDQFRTPGELARALSIEASELNELFLWDREAPPERVEEELVDVLIYALFLADKYDLDVETIIRDKIEANRRRYSLDKAKGTSEKQ